MKVKYSKDFEKSVRKLSGKILSPVRNTILEVKNASSLDEITDCADFGDDHPGISAITTHLS